MPSEATALVIRLGVSAWLIGLSISDVRRRQLPHLWTTLPMLIMGGLAAVRGLLAVAGSGWNDVAMGLAWLAVLLSDSLALATLPAAAALGVAFVLGSAAGQVVVVTWLIALGLALAGIWGAGDAKVMMILLAVFPDPRLALTALGACAVGGLGLMIGQLRAATPYWLVALARDALHLKFPSRTGEAGQLVVPLLPLLTIGALFYLWGIGR